MQITIHMFPLFVAFSVFLPLLSLTLSIYTSQPQSILGRGQFALAVKSCRGLSSAGQLCRIRSFP